MWALQGTLNFTRYYFKHAYNRKFVVGQHHKAIAEALDSVLDGETTRLIINMPPRYGKAIDIHTPMLTTDGWKEAKKINIGDCLFGDDGKPTKVVGKYPQGETANYKVTLSDGSSLVTCGQHLWAAKTRDDVKYKKGWRVVNTERIMEKVVCRDGHLNWHIPTARPIEMPERELPIDPYLLGCWLGDGSTYKAEFTSMDKEVVDAFAAQYKITVRTHQNSGKALTYGICDGFVAKLREIGVLRDKHIPECYMLASEGQRLALLQGLMDTDGTCNRKNHQTSYCSTKERLRHDVRTLAESLGMAVVENGYNLFIKSDVCPFTLPRHIERWEPAGNRHHTKRFIESIEPCGSGETVCFEVDNESHLYLAGRDLIVTHNTELAVKHFLAMGFAVNPRSRFIHLSYSDDLVRDNSKGVQAILNMPQYQRFFPNVKPSTTNSRKWFTPDGGGLYAVSSAGQVTGFGAGLVDREDDELGNTVEDLDKVAAAGDEFGGAIVIDDPLKPDDALSDNMREKVNQKFETTIRNRVNSRRTPIIIIMQRLHEHDLCGYLMETEPDEWKVISLPVLYTDDKGEERALWPFKHTVEELHKLRDINPFVFETQYMQNPKPLEGLMYSQGFRTYSVIPQSRHRVVKACCDSADTGADYLCDIIYVETETANYVLDVLFTKKPVEYTVPKNAERYTKYKVQRALIESNNGGRIFALDVEKECRMMGNNTTRFTSFTQTGNKQVRIFSHSAEVQNLTFFPEGWEKLWPEFARSILGFLKEGRNEHDDSCFVAGTKVATIFGDKPIEKIVPGDMVITPFGVRKVLASGCTGEKEVVTMFGLTATPNHHVYDNKSFIELVCCEESGLSRYSLKEQIRWRYKKLLCSKELNTDSWGRGNITLVSRKAMRDGGMPKDFMWRFGKMLTECQFRKAVAFTTKMATLTITTLAIWSVYRATNICRYMHERICREKNTGKTYVEISTEQERKQMNGTEVKREEHGTANIQNIRLGCTKRLSARIVASISSLFSKTQCSAATNAVSNIEQRSINMSECASSAEKSSTMASVTLEQKIDNFAAYHAAQHTTTSIANVYNIKVDKDGCFYANGILVSNCDCLTMTVEHRDISSKENEIALRNVLRR